jgi:spore coat protein U-like protein
MIAITQVPPSVWRQLVRRLTLVMAILCSGLYSSHAAASGEQQVDAAPDVNPAQIHCTLEAAALNFGHLQLPLKTTYVGVGEITAVCHNQSSTVRRVELTLTFPTMGQQSELLQGNRGTLAVTFYRDPQFVERWGDDQNGAGIILELMPGEQRRLRLSVHALLQISRNSEAGVYNTHIPITLSARPI